jgi:hypothetical protein
MNLTESQREAIIEKHLQGLSQNGIVQVLGIAKPYVNAVVRRYREENLAGITGNSESLPVTKPVIKPEIHEFQFSNSNTSPEIYYLKRHIADLEDRLRDYKSELATEKLNHESVKKEYALLKIDYDTQEQRHRLEIEKKDSAVEANQKSGLNGLIDPIITPFTKNEKFMEALGIGIAKMLENKVGGGTQEIGEAKPKHPEISDPEVEKMVTQIPEALENFNKEKLKALYDMIGVFLHPHFPGLLEETHAKLIAYIKSNAHQNHDSRSNSTSR